MYIFKNDNEYHYILLHDRVFLKKNRVEHNKTRYLLCRVFIFFFIIQYSRAVVIAFLYSYQNIVKSKKKDRYIYMHFHYNLLFKRDGHTYVRRRGLCSSCYTSSGIGCDRCDIWIFQIKEKFSKRISARYYISNTFSYKNYQYLFSILQLMVVWE